MARVVVGADTWVRPYNGKGAPMAHILSRPLITKELRQTLRGPAALVLQNLLLTVAAVTAVVACLGGGSGETPTWQIGARTFWILMSIQAVMAVLLGAALTAPGVSSEHEQKTIDILRSTPLASRQIAWSKFTGALLTGCAVLGVSLPVAVGLFFLGGVSTTALVCAYILLFGALVWGAMLGLYCSALTRHTAAAVPVAIIGALVVAVVTAPFAQGPSALAALTPLGTLLRMLEGGDVRLFGAAIPVWAAGLLAWCVAAATLAEASVQLLTEEHRRRLWGTRWRFGILFLLVALAAVGSLDLLRRVGYPYGPLIYPPTPQQVAETQGELLGMYTTAFGVALAYVLTPLFCAGARGPLDGSKPRKGYGLLERLFGYSMAAGLRYVLLLTVVAWAMSQVGLLVWGNGLFDRWCGTLTLAFVPIVAAVWGFGKLAELIGLIPWPRSDVGRKLFVFVLIALLMAGWAIPAMMLSWGHPEPSAASEVMMACTMPAGVVAAFPSPAKVWASAAMDRLAAALPLPIFAALVHVAGGLLCLGLTALLRSRRTRKAAAHRSEG
ncbi:MAG: ABC transporter permease [Armatimonadetes bacterium]|nr:ABC transporter permease [Armatimonadota bacterium]